MEKTEKNNATIVLNASYTKKEKANPADVSKHNSNRKTQCILLIISNGELHEAKSGGRQQWHYSKIIIKIIITVIKRNKIK